ncbi:hypothetical protein I4I73_30345 [Pseudonocardia sp. KRD-184]|uniref:Uncharacterized protein n=2 Tax=Pseudonocardia oceani TaxID=2792013 RepID=A0ABS6U1S5_9PSEU|nr:hypothetical protein [Pseudonocardia oceani]MBW0093641.1 hypothetical protein [Pseudonocardia oceani]MBW0100284.1 hypothetical protein [Pseudonocardia oceani]MBW0112305.1 hypothetical protein [Pseudonocardia oceani]MBW0122404.1 hypothetical protein [Pseudonocardia oceani]MBW0126203.1 hypothetical protein [Pseudonocardia oceani]
MVLAISFLEAPLKFRAPGITVRLGLGIGRIVFRALNVAEGVLLVVAAVAVAVGDAPGAVLVPLVALAVLLAAQLLVLRPRLNRRSDRVLAGEDLPRSREHIVYVAAEVVKVALLVTLGVGALSAVG